MKKTFLLLVILLYLFGVLVRIAGQAMVNKEPINWKSTLTLGEFDGSQDYGPRWKVRIAVMLLLPFVWLQFLKKKIEKVV
jgi:hypothetical protein